MSVQSFGWRDLRMAVTGAATGGGAPAQTLFGPSPVIKQTSFGIGDSVYLACHVDHDILEGSTVYPHVHWSTSGTQVASVKWQLSYTFAAGHNTANFPAPTVITVEQAAHGTAWRHMITEHPTGFVVPDIDSILLFELKRITNGATNNTNTVFGLFVDLHYQTGQYATKNRTPNFFGEYILIV